MVESIYDGRCAAKRAGETPAWEAAIEQLKTHSEQTMQSFQQEVDKLSTAATTAVENLRENLQEVRESLAVSKYHEEAARKELEALKRDSRSPANLAVRNSCPESQLLELKKVHSSLELEMGSLKKRATVADNLKLENARLKKRLSQLELPAEVKAAVLRSQQVDGLETQLSTATLRIAVLEREVKVTRKPSARLIAVLARKEVVLKKQEQMLAGVRREVRDLRRDLISHQEQLASAKATILRLEDIAPYVNQSFVSEAVRTFRKIKADNRWGLVEATQNVIRHVVDHTTENITHALKIGSGASAMLVGAVPDPDDFPGFAEVRRRSR